MTALYLEGRSSGVGPDSLSFCLYNAGTGHATMWIFTEIKRAAADAENRAADGENAGGGGAIHTDTRASPTLPSLIRVRALWQHHGQPTIRSLLARQLSWLPMLTSHGCLPM